MTNLLPILLLTLSWTPSPDATGYRVYHSVSRIPQRPPLTNVVDVGPATNYFLAVPPGQYDWLAVTAYDAHGQESEFGRTAVSTNANHLVVNFSP